MSRSKPYDRARAERNVDEPWKHDLHDTRGTLASRLGAGGSSSSSQRSGASSSLFDRISGGQGKELLPDSAPRKRMYGYDGGASAGGASGSGRNAGIELLPSGGAASGSGAGRAARSGRASRPRGSTGDDAGQRALVANGLAALSKRNNNPTTSTSRDGLSIVGAARTSIWVRVERLARGTTAEDVKSAFAHAPIWEARLVSSRGGTVTVDVELPDRDSAERLVQQYDGVAADGERLRVSVRNRDAPVRGINNDTRGEVRGDTRGSGRAGGLSSRMDSRNDAAASGKMYSDKIDGPPAVTAPRETREMQTRPTSLASRLGRR